MPYILEKDRPQFKPYLDSVLNEEKQDILIVIKNTKKLVSLIRNNGDLNYVISYLVWSTFDKKPSYALGDELIDSLENVLYNLDFFNSTNGYSFKTELEHEIYRIVTYALDTHRVKTVKGTLRNVILEFYRRRLVDLEDSKINNPENGDIL